MSYRYALGSSVALPRPAIRSRALWSLLVAYTLFVVADIAVSWVAFSQLARRHVPIWRGEWNPLTAPVLHAWGVPGMLAVSAVCVALPWALLLLLWRLEFHRPVLVLLVACCLIRGGIVGYDLSRLSTLPPQGPVPGAIGTPTASATATPRPMPTATPTPLPTATPTPPPTATPRPNPTATATPCHHGCG